MNQSKEIKALTGIRGIAALYVALYHSLEVQHFGPTSGFQVFINHGYIAVDLFFILSGFVMTLSSKRYFEREVTIRAYIAFMKKRFARLYPMYFVVLVVGFIFLNHFSGKLNFIIGLSMLSVLFAPGYVLVHMWSLSTEWIAYLIYPLLLKIGYRYDKAIWSVFIISLALLLIYFSFGLKASLLPVNGDFAIPSVPALIRCFAEYLLGIAAYQIVSNHPKIILFQNTISATSLMLIIGLLFFKVSDLYVIFLFVPLIGSLSTGESGVGLFMASKFIYFLGLISYSLYLIHPIFLYYFQKSFYEKYGNLEYNFIMFNSLYVIVIISVSYFTFKLIELPMQKILNQKLTLRFLKHKFF